MVKLRLLVDDCGILIMKGKNVTSLNVNIVSYWIKHEKFMGINKKLGPLPISLRFCIRLVLDFVFKVIMLLNESNVPREMKPVKV